MMAHAQTHTDGWMVDRCFSAEQSVQSFSSMCRCVLSKCRRFYVIQGIYYTQHNPEAFAYPAKPKVNLLLHRNSDGFELITLFWF